MKSVQYGVTQPVSEALPTQRELELNEALTDVLAQEGMIESEKKAQLRYRPFVDNITTIIPRVGSVLMIDLTEIGKQCYSNLI